MHLYSIKICGCVFKTMSIIKYLCKTACERLFDAYVFLEDNSSIKASARPQQTTGHLSHTAANKVIKQDKSSRNHHLVHAHFYLSHIRWLPDSLGPHDAPLFARHCLVCFDLKLDAVCFTKFNFEDRTTKTL